MRQAYRIHYLSVLYALLSGSPIGKFVPGFESRGLRLGCDLIYTKPNNRQFLTPDYFLY